MNHNLQNAILFVFLLTTMLILILTKYLNIYFSIGLLLTIIITVWFLDTPKDD